MKPLTISEITATTTAANLFGVKSNADITALCADPDKLYEAIKGNDELIQAIEATADASGALEPQEVLDAINNYLMAIKAEIKNAAKGSNPVVTVNNRSYSFATVQAPAKEQTRVFVMTEARNYGEIRKSRTANGSNYRPVNIGGYYLINNQDGSISTHPDNILTNSALVSKFLKSYDINSNETLIIEDNLAFNVVTESRIAGVTTYLETAPEAVQAAKGKDAKDVVRGVNAAGQPTILCYHSVTSEFAFRRLGTKITDSHLTMLTKNVERVAEARLKAIEDTAKDKELAEVNTKKEVAVVEAKETAAAKAIELKINAVVGQAALLSQHGINMQALLIAALGGQQEK